MYIGLIIKGPPSQRGPHHIPYACEIWLFWSRSVFGVQLGHSKHMVGWLMSLQVGKLTAMFVWLHHSHEQQNRTISSMILKSPISGHPLPFTQKTWPPQEFLPTWKDIKSSIPPNSERILFQYSSESTGLMNSKKPMGRCWWRLVLVVFFRDRGNEDCGQCRETGACFLGVWSNKNHAEETYDMWHDIPIHKGVKLYLFFVEFYLSSRNVWTPFGVCWMMKLSMMPLGWNRKRSVSSWGNWWFLIAGICAKHTHRIHVWYIYLHVP